MGPDSGEVPILFRFLTVQRSQTRHAGGCNRPRKINPPLLQDCSVAGVAATPADFGNGFRDLGLDFQVPQVALVPRVSMWTKVL
jgi:hypothetical protein